jgi:hypothetical protein
MILMVVAVSDDVLLVADSLFDSLADWLVEALSLTDSLFDVSALELAGFAQALTKANDTTNNEINFLFMNGPLGFNHTRIDVLCRGKAKKRQEEQILFRI